MDVSSCEIPDVKRLRSPVHGDPRGYLSEIYNSKQASRAGLSARFVQDNLTCSEAAGTVRGLHFQTPPFAQQKLVIVLSGAVFDVAVDVRAGSPTFGRHVAVTLAEEGDQLLVPEGFAHGFATLEADTRVLYKLTAHYAPDHERGLYWADPELGIKWPVTPEEAVVSDKDRRWPRLAELPAFFGADKGE